MLTPTHICVDHILTPSCPFSLCMSLWFMCDVRHQHQAHQPINSKACPNKNIHIIRGQSNRLSSPPPGWRPQTRPGPRYPAPSSPGTSSVHQPADQTVPLQKHTPGRQADSGSIRLCFCFSMGCTPQPAYQTMLLQKHTPGRQAGM